MAAMTLSSHGSDDAIISADFSAAQLWSAIMTASDAMFLRIPKSCAFRLRNRLLNELVATRTRSMMLFSTAEMEALMGHLEGAGGQGR